MSTPRRSVRKSIEKKNAKEAYDNFRDRKVDERKSGKLLGK